MTMICHDHDGPWAIRERLKLVLTILKGQLTVQQACAEYGLCASQVDQWMDEAGEIMEIAINTYPQCVLDLYEQRICALQCEYIVAIQIRDTFRIRERAMRDARENNEDSQQSRSLDGKDKP